MPNHIICCLGVKTTHIVCRIISKIPARRRQKTSHARSKISEQIHLPAANLDELVITTRLRGLLSPISGAGTPDKIWMPCPSYVSERSTLGQSLWSVSDHTRPRIRPTAGPPAGRRLRRRPAGGPAVGRWLAGVGRPRISACVWGQRMILIASKYSKALWKSFSRGEFCPDFVVAFTCTDKERSYRCLHSYVVTKYNWCKKWNAKYINAFKNITSKIYIRITLSLFC